MSQRIAAKITAVAGYVPPRVVTNADLEKIVDTTDDWIRTRTGIRERHYADPGVASSHLGTEAAKKLLAAKGVSPEEIDMIVVATVTPDMLFPATACLIQNRLGATKAWGFDLSAACSGFAYALTVGAQFVGSGAHKKVLVIGTDVMTSILDFKDRATCVLFGDGAGAVLLEPAASDAEGIIDFAHDIDGSGGCNLYMPAGGSLHPPSHETVEKRMHYVHQEGQQVFKYAVRRQAELACQMLERNGLSSRDLALVVPHQANSAHHSRHAGTPGRGRLQSPGQYRSLRQHHRRHNPPGPGRRRRAKAPPQRRPGFAGRRRRRLHRRLRPDALGLLAILRRTMWLLSPAGPDSS